jgi:AbrB family looped-hinge helix DNA binding protein
MGEHDLVEKVILDDRGRVTIPKSIREKHNFFPGEEFEIVDENDKLILKLLIPKQKTVKSSAEWGKNTFFKAGESTFGE